jgi:hypothetical protein
MAWISDGEAGSAVRAKLNSLMVPIGDPSVVTDPVAYVDVTLPSGYSPFFRMELEDLRMDDGGPARQSLMLSSDGVDFGDTDNWDSYIGWLKTDWAHTYQFPPESTATFDGSHTEIFQGVGYSAILNDDTTASLTGQINVFAGSSTAHAIVAASLASNYLIDAAEDVAGEQTLFALNSYWTLNAHATIPILPARMTTIRFLPSFGSGTVTQGAILFGVPTP